MTERFTLKMFTDQMGSFTQPGCTSHEDALWHVNNARAHDGIAPLTADQFDALFRGTNWGWARFEPEAAR